MCSRAAVNRVHRCTFSASISPSHTLSPGHPFEPPNKMLECNKNAAVWIWSHTPGYAHTKNEYSYILAYVKWGTPYWSNINEALNNIHGYRGFASRIGVWYEPIRVFRRKLMQMLVVVAILCCLIVICLGFRVTSWQRAKNGQKVWVIDGVLCKIWLSTDMCCL